MSRKVNKPNQVETKMISFSEPKILPSGAKQVYLNYNGGRLVVQTPKMSLPWNMGCYRGPEGNQPPTYKLDLSFKGMENDPKIKELHDMIEKIDKRMLKAGAENGLAWFKKKDMNEEVLKALYTPMMKLSIDKNTGEPDGKWPPSVRIKVPNYDGKFSCEVFDTEKNEIDTSNLENVLVRGCEVQSLIECSSVWFAGGKYGLSWKIVQMKVQSVPNLNGYAFVDSDGDSDGDSSEPPSPNGVSNNAPDPNFVEDSDSESDSDIEVSDEAEPDPPVSSKKKKRSNK